MSYVAWLERREERIVARLGDVLKEYGLDMDPQEFVATIVDLFHALYPGFNEDRLLVRPREAIRLCDAVRDKVREWDLPDELILQALLNNRK